MTTLILSITSCSEKQAGNPLLEHFTTPHQTPPFDRIETRHYEPAFDQAIEEAKQEIKAISTSAEAPDFENTIVALDQAGDFFDFFQSKLRLHQRRNATDRPTDFTETD